MNNSKITIELTGSEETVLMSALFNAEALAKQRGNTWFASELEKLEDKFLDLLNHAHEGEENDEC